MKEIATYFLRLGCLGFGGPLAIIAQIQKDLVNDRQWIEKDEFQTIFPLIKSMPGPVAFQLAVFLSYRRKGFWGGLVAGFCLVFPAFVLVMLVAKFEAIFLQNPVLHAAMKGFELGALALILGALFNLAQNQTRKPSFWLWFGLAIFAVGLLDISEAKMVLLTLLSCGLWVWQRSRKSILTEASSALLALFVMSIKAGALVFGTGLAIVPMLEATVVGQMHWLTSEQFLQAFAIGQITPGPVVITVSYIGYKVAGLAGATVATVAIFLPAFVHMTTWFPRTIGWLRQRTWISFVSSCLTGTIVGVIALVILKMFRPLGPQQVAITLCLYILLTWKKWPSWFCILLSGAIGALLMA